MLQIRTADGQFDRIECLAKHIIDKCIEHKKEKRAFAFALIVYDFNDPHIVKILEDKDYFNALDHISGKLLTVFCVHSEYLHYQSEKNKEYKKIRIEQRAHKVNGIVNISPKTLGEELINKDTLPSPSIIFFNTSGVNITDYTIAKLRENQIEKGFIELLEIISVAVGALSNVKEEYRDNEKDIFSLLKDATNKSESWKNTKLLFNKTIKVRNFLSFFL